jgi:hypothetical protein
MVASIEASFAAASPFTPVVLADLPSQAAAGLAVHDLLAVHDDFCAWAPKASAEKRIIEKSTFFIVYSFLSYSIL